MRNLLLLSICLPLLINGMAVSYRKHEFSDPEPHRIHALEIDPQQVSIVLEHALEQREPVSHIAGRTHAIAGINAGFFRRGGVLNGRSLGLLKTGATVFADPELDRSALVWNQASDIAIKHTKIAWQIAINGQTVPVTMINQPYAPGTLALFLPSFGRYTYTTASCTQYTVRNNAITAITENGWTAIPQDGYVIAFDTGCAKKLGLTPLTIGQTAVLGAQTPLATHMVDGAGTLISNGIEQTAEQIADELRAGNALTQLADEASINYHDEKQTGWLINGQHPRSAIGITSSGKVLLVVVEGRQGEIKGLTLPQLATFMHKLGCDQALNLGGGGDSTLVLEGRVLNTPSGSSRDAASVDERPVSDAILVFEQGRQN